MSTTTDESTHALKRSNRKKLTRKESFAASSLESLSRTGSELYDPSSDEQNSTPVLESSPLSASHSRASLTSFKRTLTQPEIPLEDTLDFSSKSQFDLSALTGLGISAVKSDSDNDTEMHSSEYHDGRPVYDPENPNPTREYSGVLTPIIVNSKSSNSNSNSNSNSSSSSSSKSNPNYSSSSKATFHSNGPVHSNGLFHSNGSIHTQGSPNPVHSSSKKRNSGVAMQQSPEEKPIYVAAPMDMDTTDDFALGHSQLHSPSELGGSPTYSRNDPKMLRRLSKSFTHSQKGTSSSSSSSSFSSSADFSSNAGFNSNSNSSSSSSSNSKTPILKRKEKEDRSPNYPQSKVQKGEKRTRDKVDHCDDQTILESNAALQKKPHKKPKRDNSKQHLAAGSDTLKPTAGSNLLNTQRAVESDTANSPVGGDTSRLQSARAAGASSSKKTFLTGFPGTGPITRQQASLQANPQGKSAFAPYSNPKLHNPKSQKKK